MFFYFFHISFAVFHFFLAKENCERPRYEGPRYKGARYKGARYKIYGPAELTGHTVGRSGQVRSLGSGEVTESGVLSSVRLHGRPVFYTWELIVFFTH